jgi:DNA polymerase-3 subunit epsilon
VNEDVEAAPTFHEIVGDVLARLRSVILVGHNVKFDRDFLSAELAREGVFLPSLPSICTMQLSYRLCPWLANHKLSTCCQGAGVDEAPFHCALEDARVTARLLMTYVRDASDTGMMTEDLLEGGKLVFPAVWPELALTGRVLVRDARSTARLDPPYLARLVANLSVTATSEAVAPYLDLLDRALSDRRLTSEEAMALEATAAAWGLTREQAIAAHQNYMDALVVAALSDGAISSSERRDLNDVGRLLGIPLGTVDAIIVSKSSIG